MTRGGSELDGLVLELGLRGVELWERRVGGAPGETRWDLRKLGVSMCVVGAEERFATAKVSWL